MEMKIKDVCSKNSTLVLSLGVFSITFFLILVFLPNRHGLELLFFYIYMTVACTFLPLPTPQIVILIAPHFNPYLIADEGKFSGVVRYATYLGAKVTYQVEIDGNILTVDVTNPQRLAPTMALFSLQKN